MKKVIIDLFLTAWALVSAFLLLIGVVLLFAGKIFAALCVLAPVVLLWKVNKSRGNKGKTAFEKMGSEIGANWNWWGNASGIAVSANNSKILLSRDGMLKTYDFHQVRSWESSRDTTRVYGTGYDVRTGFDAAQSKLGAVAQRWANTGLFLSVKDIEHPQWHIQMMDEKDLAQWFEILTQTINEKATVEVA